VEVTEQMAVAKTPSRTAREVLDLIKQLPDAYRETLVLRFVEGMTGPEIASRTGLTPASVRVNLHRGTKLLRERMGVAEARP
jgi:RNA polymerase sigma-70 factor (ECF subfamily)